MQFFHTPPFLSEPQPSLAAIGNFDGLHLGHQALFQQLKSLAKEKGLLSSVIFFEPQPQEFFHPSEAPARLQRVSEKLATLKTLGIDQVFCVRFDEALANETPEAFLAKLRAWNIRGLCVGADFRFGKNRVGDIYFLKNQQDFFVSIAEDFKLEGERVSSTAIRQALHAGDFAKAGKFLGRPYAMSGHVIHGKKVGRLLDFPTANLAVKRLLSPLWGVYVVRIFLPSGESFYGVANLGVRPTLTDGQHWFLESFLFAKQEPNLYGKRMIVEFLHKIRDEQKFDSFEALKAQIQKDVDFALAYRPS